VTAAAGLPRVTLRKPLARAIRGGHPWIYRDALDGAPRIASGTAVLVAGRDGRRLARGYWDAHSPIAVRVLGAPDEDPQALVPARLEAALAHRSPSDGRLSLGSRRS
jgi:23S rRNA G2069 N7-methylase RlmK/C1962 C5-methylase RlmI